MPQAGPHWISKLPLARGYSAAVLSVVAALIITLQSHTETAPVSLLFCAVMFSSWLAGLHVGLLATALSILAFGYYLAGPDHLLAMDFVSVQRLGAFSLAALFVCLVSAAQRRATQSLRKTRDDLASKVQELERTNQALHAENAERRRTEALLRESEQRLRALVGSVDEIVFEFAEDGTYLNVWTRDERLLVRPRSELIGRRASEVMGHETAEEYLEAFRRVLTSRRAETLEYQLPLPVGSRWFLSRINPIPAADGSCRTVSVLARDVTERKHGEQRLAAQYAVTRALAESANLAAATPHLLRGIGDNLEWHWGALWVVHRQSGRLRCRSTWQHMEKAETAACGSINQEADVAPGQGLAGRVWHSAEPIWIVDVAKESEPPIAATAGLRGAVAFPILLDREVLGVVEFFDRAAREPDQEQLATLSAIGSQIGQFLKRRDAEEHLQENEKRFRALIEHSSDAILMVDRQGTILYASPPFERILGYAPEEVVGWNRLFFVDPDQRGDSVVSFVGLLEETGKSATLQRRVRHKDGSWRWLETTLTNWLDEPAVQAIVANVRDITERKQAEEALRESEQRFRDHAETASDFLWETGPDHHFKYTTEPLNTLRITPARLVGARRWDLATDFEEEAEKWREHIAVVEAHLPFRDFVYKTTRADGSLVYVSTNAKPIFDADGVFQGYRGAASDVTAAVRARQAEEALQQARSELAHISRVTTLGEITASIAHEINQPLAAVVTNASACRRWLAGQPPNMEEAREALDRIVRDGNRASDILRRIRALLNKSGGVMQRLNINEIVLEVIALLRNELDGNRVALKLQLSRDLPQVKGDRVQLQQVILNLIVNATEAMRGYRTDGRELLVGSSREASNGVLVTVADSGPGLDLSRIDRLFDAFYTTKQEGMGMGLAISRSIVEAHGGRLWATPNAPKGAAFHFALPAEEDEAMLPQQTVTPPQLMPGQ